MDITPRPRARELSSEPRAPAGAGLPTPPFTPHVRPTGPLRPPRTVKVVPNELLLEFFELAVDAAIAEDCCGYLPWLSNILSIGSVCRKWRGVLHGQSHPRFWKIVYILPTRSVECLDWQLRKLRGSSHANLRLEIFVQPWQKYALDDSCVARFSSSLQELVSVVTDVQAAPSIFSRCNDIRIQGSVEDWARVLNGIFPLLPALTTTVSNFSAICYVDATTVIDLSCPFPLESLPLPPTLLRLSLNFLPLTSISWDWGTFTRLRSLDLYFHVPDPRNSNIVDVSALGNLDVFAMRNLLQNVAPTLTSLRLGRWWTDLLNLEPLEAPQHVVLPCLTDLTLIWYSVKNMQRIVGLFTAPNLKRALLQDVDMTQESAWQSMPTVASWAGLECLILRIVNPGYTETYDLRRLLEGLVGLKRLHIQFLRRSWERFFYDYLEDPLTDPAVCPNLVRFTFGYESRSYRPESTQTSSFESGSAAQSQAAQSQPEASRLISDKTDAWREGTPTEADSQAYTDMQESVSQPSASAALTRLNTLMSVVSRPNLSNIMAALEDAVLEEGPLRTRASSVAISFGSQGSSNNVSSSIGGGSSHLSIECGSSQIPVGYGSQGSYASSLGRFLDSDSQISTSAQSQIAGTGSGSQMSLRSVSRSSVVTDMELSRIVDEMLFQRRKHLLPGALKAAVIPLRNFSYDRYD